MVMNGNKSDDPGPLRVGVAEKINARGLFLPTAKKCMMRARSMVCSCGRVFD